MNLGLRLPTSEYLNYPISSFVILLLWLAWRYPGVNRTLFLLTTKQGFWNFRDCSRGFVSWGQTSVFHGQFSSYVMTLKFPSHTPLLMRRFVAYIWLYSYRKLILIVRAGSTGCCVRMVPRRNSIVLTELWYAGFETVRISRFQGRSITAANTVFRWVDERHAERHYYTSSRTGWSYAILRTMRLSKLGLSEGEETLGTMKHASSLPEMKVMLWWIALPFGSECLNVSQESYYPEVFVRSFRQIDLQAEHDSVLAEVS
jgi:hypothetical protein